MELAILPLVPLCNVCRHPHGLAGLEEIVDSTTKRQPDLDKIQSNRQHFLDLCELLSEPKPATADPDGTEYTFERGVSNSGGGKGWADVWKRQYFDWEYKGKHKDLVEAYNQMLYREALENPPLLVVSDMDRFEVHTNFTNSVKTIHTFNPESLEN